MSKIVQQLKAGSTQSNIQPHVLWSNLAVPAQGHQSIKRQHIADYVGESVEPKLVLFRAGAGFGKTLAMREYFGQLEEQSVATAWLTLCALDNEFQRFLIHLMAVFRVAINGREFAQKTISMDAGIDQQAFELMSEIDSVEKPFAVFIDQYELASSPSSDDFLRLILSRLPANGQLVIASRETPKVQLGRLRALGHFVEIDQARLCFSLEETATFLQDKCKLALSDANVKKLHGDTEGWPAALWLAATALKGRKNTEGFISSFSGSNSMVAEYLAEDVLLQQPDDVHEFLLKTSILRDFSEEVCNVLCSRTDSGALLQKLELSSLCSSTHDGKHNLYRYNSLFADFLRAQLQQQYSEEIPNLHLKAAKWYEAEGRPVLAIDHALQSGDQDYALSLLDDHVDDLLFWGRFRLLARWLDAQPSDMLASKYRLRLAHIWALAFTWHAARASQLLESLSQDTLASDVTPDIQDEIAALRFYILISSDRTKELREAIDTLPVDSTKLFKFTRNVYSVTFATFKVAEGEFSEAIDVLEHSNMVDNGQIKTFSVAYARVIEGVIDLAQGRVREAMANFRVVLSESATGYDRRSMTKLIAGIHLAQALYVVGDEEESEQLLAFYMPVVREYGPPDTLIISHVVEARIAYNRGDVDRTFLRLSELEHLGLQSKLPRMIAAAQLERARIALLNDDLTLAQRHYERANNPDVWDGMQGIVMAANDVETTCLCKFRLLIRGSIKEDVVQDIKSAIKSAKSMQRYRRALVLELILAKAQHLVGNPRVAMRILQNVLEVAAQGGLVRIFLDEGAPILELLREFRVAKQGATGVGQDDEVAAFVDKVLLLAGFTVGAASDDTIIDVGVVLSPRESQILDLLSLGLSNIKIAESIFVTETTVRAHLRKINVKLGTGNRTQAVSVARRLGLIK